MTVSTSSVISRASEAKMLQGHKSYLQQQRIIRKNPDNRDRSCLHCGSRKAFYDNTERRYELTKNCWECHCTFGTQPLIKRKQLIDLNEFRQQLTGGNTALQFGGMKVGLDQRFNDPWTHNVSYDGFNLFCNFPNQRAMDRFIDYLTWEGVDSPFKPTDEQICEFFLRSIHFKFLVIDNDGVTFIPIVQPFGHIKMMVCNKPELVETQTGGYEITGQPEIWFTLDNKLRVKWTQKKVTLDPPRWMVPLLSSVKVASYHRFGACSRSCSYFVDEEIDECHSTETTYNLPIVKWDSDQFIFVGDFEQLPKEIHFQIFSGCSRQLARLNRGFRFLSRFVLNFKLGPFLDDRIHCLKVLGISSCGTKWSMSKRSTCNKEVLDSMDSMELTEEEGREFVYDKSMSQHKFLGSRLESMNKVKVSHKRFIRWARKRNCHDFFDYIVNIPRGRSPYFVEPIESITHNDLSWENGNW